jgi:hypothetical protein
MIKTKIGVWRLLSWTVLACGVFWANAVSAAPTVLTMPGGINNPPSKQTYYAWAGNPVRFWGRVKWGATSSTGTYELNCDNGSPPSTGVVTNQHDIGANCTYAGAGTYFPTLTVTDGNGDSDSSQTRIDVVAVVDKRAQTNFAIERGLKYLYDNYVSNGLSGQMRISSAYIPGQTAASLLAFELRGHRPGIDATDRAAKEASEIYAELVHKALDYILSSLQTQSIGVQGAGNPDANSNGIGLYTSSDRITYNIGMVMMALVGTGDVASGGSIVATVGGPNVLGRTLGGINGIVQDLADYCSWAQVEPSRGFYRGGWRYTANYPNSDNSVSQWCPIGLDEAEVQWGTIIPDFVKTENSMWTTNSQHPVSGQFGYTGTSGGTPVTMSGAGIAQLSMQGVPQSDSKIIAAHTYIDNNFNSIIAGTYQDIYGMYAVTKGLRAGRDTSGNRQTIDLIGTPPTRNWYDEYSTKLISSQLANGQWQDTYAVSSYIFETAWAVEILVPAISTPLPEADAGGPYTVLANQNVNLDGCGSFHHGISQGKFLVSYEWDIDDDGTYDISTSSPVCTATVVGGYPDTGSDYSVNVRLRVTDNDGITDEDVTQVNITTGNLPPVADPGGPYLGAIGVPVTLDGSASFDPNAGEPSCGTIVQYEWDLDGNGSFEVNGGASPTYVNTWSTAYNGDIGLRVTDDCGAQGTSSVYAKISVSDIQPIVDSYNVVGITRLSRFVFEYEVELTLANVGTGDATNVSADLIDFPANVAIVDGMVTFGNIQAGATVTGTDTFTIQVDRSIPVSSDDLRWRVQYTDASTSGSVDVVIPWLP